jgi:queuine/archaeosine tRNA-ribosyltransferase
MKAYVHHLFVVKEMLGPAALTAHNLHQITRFLNAMSPAVEKQ